MSKKAAKPKDEISYEIRDIVLAKIRGFPAWPAMVSLCSLLRIASNPRGNLFGLVFLISYMSRLLILTMFQKKLLRNAPRAKSRPSIVCGSSPSVTSAYLIYYSREPPL